MIKIKDLSKSYKDGLGINHVLKNINLTIEQGSFITIMGHSGCGKTTLLNILSLLDEPSSGKVYFGDIEINYKKRKAIENLRRDKIGLVFQNANLISCLTPLENILIACNESDRKKNKKRALYLLEKVGIKNKANKNVKTLSGGEAQRVSIVRALINKPDILLCDEPTGALDDNTSQKVLNLLKEQSIDEGCSLIIVTHEKEIGELGDKKIEIVEGAIYEMD